jgi:hypothetical protein
MHVYCLHNISNCSDAPLSFLGYMTRVAGYAESSQKTWHASNPLGDLSVQRVERRREVVLQGVYAEVHAEVHAEVVPSPQCK